MSFIPGMMPSFNRISGSVPFSPLSLFGGSDKGWWLDSSDLSTLFQNSNGTTAVSANNDPVGYWGDKSGNGNHAIQATSGLRPLYTTSFGVKGDGVDDALRCTLNSTITNSTLWCAMALRIEAFSADHYRRVHGVTNVVGDADASHPSAGIFLTTIATSPNLGGYRSGQRATSGTLSAGKKYVMESHFDSVDHRLTVNGIEVPVPVGSTGAFSAVQMAIFANTQVNVNECGNFSIPELVVIDRTPTSQEILDCREYLKNKWGFYAWNPDDKHASISLSGGNLTATGSVNLKGIRACSSHATGKYYYEATVVTSAVLATLGIAGSSWNVDDWVGDANPSVGWFGTEMHSDGAIGTIYSFAAGDVLCIAVDLDNKKIWGRKNNSNWNNDAGADPAAGTGGFTYTTNDSAFHPAGTPSASGSLTVNLGGSAYAQTPPAGFSNW